MSNRALPLLAKLLATFAVLAVALVAASWLWHHYGVAPWTRDGRLRANVVQVSSDVNALVTEVRVKDDQPVRNGDVLLVLDPSRYQLALDRAEAAIAATTAALQQATRENRRNTVLGDLSTREQREQGAARVAELRAQLQQAIAQRDAARLDVERTVVRASVDGVVTNLEIRPGEYAAPGRRLLALVETASFRVDGYFEETQVALIRVGDPAVIRIMGIGRELRGTVASIAGGIEDRERGPSGNGLANITPNYSWVRLAQRIPVRIQLGEVPDGVRLIAGRTASVAVQLPAGRRTEGDE